MNEVNGMAVVDRLLREHGMIAADETWVHGMWTPGKWWRCVRAKLAGKKLVRMTHGSLSPVYLERQGKWRKRLARPIERALFAMADRVVVTCEAEREWCEKWGVKGPFEVVDLKRFFKIRDKREEIRDKMEEGKELRVLYLGRRHPLKGVAELEEAVRVTNLSDRLVTLRVVSDHFGEELEADWRWADVLCLPTLSENFGLVVAEALERGVPVITTDGAPAWRGQEGVTYIEGYCDAGFEERVKMLCKEIRDKR